MTVLLAIVVDVSIVLALSLAGLAALKGLSASVRHAVLSGAIVAAVLAPALELFVPQVPLLLWTNSAPVLATGSTPLPSDTPAAVDRLAAVPPGAPGLSWTALLLAVWALGAIVALARLSISLLRAARLTTGCTPVRGGRWREIADALAGASGMRSVALLQSHDPSLLVACGVLRPSIVLPAGAEVWADDLMRSVLAHELAHVRRRDNAIQLVAELLRAAHWFNPLVWLACRRLRQESEHACDDAVLRGGVDAADYAAHLLGVARDVAGRHRAWASVAAIANPSTLERRISAVLNHHRSRAPLTRRGRAVAMLTAAVVVPIAAGTVASPAASNFVARGESVDISLIPAPVTPEPGPPATVTWRNATARTTTTAVAAAQASGTVSGTMLDSTGAVLPGVSVTVRNAALNLERTTVTDADGRFAFRDLQPVRYELMAMLSGFETVTIALSLGAGAVVDRPIRMPIGTLAEMISVGCSGSPVASVAQPSRPGNGIRTAPSSRGTGPRRFQDVLERALQAIVPVAFAQQRMPVRVGGNIQLPVKVTSVNPLCPNAPIPATGTVVRLIGRIGVNGSVTDVKPIPAAPEDTPRAEFIASAVDAVRQWTFTPTLLNGQPTEASMVVVVRYQM